MKTRIRYTTGVGPRWVQWAFGTFVLLGVSGCGAAHNVPNAADDSLAPEEARVAVRVQPAERRSIAQSVTALGRCEALPKKLALLATAVEGQVQSLLVEQGQQVTARQPIIQLDTTLAKADLAEKQANRDSLAAALILLQSLPRGQEQEASKLTIETAKIAVVRAESLVERLRPLRARGELAEQQMFEAEQALKEARVQQQAAEAQLTVLMLSPRPEAIDEAQAKIQAAEQAVQGSQTRLELYTIRAPIDGVLNSLNCRPGQMVAIGTSVGEVVDNRQVLATVWLPVREGRLICDGQSASVRITSGGATTRATPEQRHEVAGRVVSTGRIADVQTGNMPVRVLVDNPRDELLVGQTLAVRILVEQSAPTLAVPAAAIHDEGEGPAVTVVRDGKTAILHPQLGASASGWIGVSDTDLQEGESVIVQGAYNLPDGTTVSVSTAEPGEVER